MDAKINILESFFKREGACIINADLDGLLSGMLLQKYCKWKIVGFSMCNGTATDNLWIDSDIAEISNLIYVDLFTPGTGFSCIDQHMVAIDDEHCRELQQEILKLNPNIIRGRTLFSDNHKNGYTAKYPFGTVHFIVNCLENIGLIKDDWSIPKKEVGSTFGAMDVMLRADRVVGNFVQYGPNCKEWANWLMDKPTHAITHSFFSDLLESPEKYLEFQSSVERKLRDLGCARGDGECTELIKSANKEKMDALLEWLADTMKLPKLIIPFSLNSFDKLSGYRIPVISSENAENLRECIKKIPGLFSYAIVSTRQISVTRLKGD